MNTEQNTENGHWMPTVQPPLTCSPVCAHGDDGNRPEEVCNFIHPLWVDGPEPVRPLTGQCEDGYGHSSAQAAEPGTRLCLSCIEDGWDNTCPLCGRPGGGNGPGGYCSTTCKEADA
jgi:hypothetical protein